MQVHPHRGSGQRVSRRSGARGRDHEPGAAPGRPAVELPGSGGTGGTLRPRGQPSQSGLYGVHLTCLWRCHRSGSGLPQLGKKTGGVLECEGGGYCSHMHFDKSLQSALWEKKTKKQPKNKSDSRRKAKWQAWKTSHRIVV